MLNNQKTIFITVFRGLIARNILTTDTFTVIRNQSNLKIVIIAPKEKEDRYQSEFGGGNVVVEGLDLPKSTKLSRFFEILFHVYL